MKKILVFGSSLMTLIIGVFLATGCSVSTNTPPLGGDPEPDGNWPSFKATPASGRVFGYDWKIVSALAKTMPSVGNPKTLDTVIELYGEEIPDVCNSTVSAKKPMASIVLPHPLREQEYTTDLFAGTGSNPLVFTSRSGRVPVNTIAEKTKISVQSIEPGKVKAKIYAYGINEDETINEINGFAAITDCSTLPQPKVAENFFKQFDFNWEGESGITGPGRDVSMVLDFVNLVKREDGYEFSGRGSCAYIDKDGYATARYMFSYGVGERHFMSNNGAIYLICRAGKIPVGKATETSFEIQMGECQDFERPNYKSLKVKMINSNTIYVQQSSADPNYTYSCAGRLDKSGS